MGSQSRQSKNIVVRLAVDQHEVRLEVAVPISIPDADQGMVLKFFRQFMIDQQICKDDLKQTINIARMAWLPLDQLEVFLKGVGILNRPHSNQPSRL